VSTETDQTLGRDSAGTTDSGGDGSSAGQAEQVPSDPTASEQDVDRAFRTILEGLRTTLPGSSTLFGFLLIVPFQGPFDSFDGVSRTAFYIAFLAAAASSALLIAPAAQQRVRAPMSGVQRRHRRHLMITVWVTILGTIAFAVALSAAVFLVSRIVFASTIAAVAAGGIVVLVLVAWFYLPLVTFERIQ
jgi:hypothetical protein